MADNFASPLDGHPAYDNSKGPSVKAVLMRTKRRFRSRQIIALAILFAVAFFLIYSLRPPTSIPRGIPKLTPEKPAPPSLKKPRPYEIGSSHPIWQLSKDADKALEETLQRQSTSLEQAVEEYRRRYGIPPPPNFDKWYQFAKSKGVQLIDEYDSIHQSLTPFWGIKPSTIRARAREAQGFDNSLMSILIRKGEVVKADGGEDWLQPATKGMMKGFLKYLPDMDLCFNLHDEPRVIVPYEDLTRLVTEAKDVAMPAAKAVTKPRNSWSRRPMDTNDGLHINEVKTTRFNVFAHQPTWTHSRMPCPPGSPARVLGDGPKMDNYDSYSVTDLGFIYNHSAFSDICQSPSLSETYGFFDRPNAFNIVHDLFPIFSQSKISTYSDILFPSPWYWDGKVPYDESLDMNWEDKADKIYWRGSTTGGFSRNGGWRRQHRQRVVEKFNAVDQAMILENQGQESKENWQVKKVPRRDFKDLFDVFFSHVGQCDPGDCAAQKEFFDIKDAADQQAAWKYKYLLDMDGNAFSGRFYAFLKSKSLVYKLGIFREWHAEWLKPWVHYIPLSLRGDEWVETMRWLTSEMEGKAAAERIALQGRLWANKVLKNEDMEVWFFRLLLE
jgi:hypothetical protein